MIGSCKECKFFQPGEAVDGKVKTGECRRNPPELVPGKEPGTVTYIGYWPKVTVTGWCGEHRPGGLGPATLGVGS
jgi:hypothetical protein